MILQLGVFLLSLLLFATWGLPVAAALRGAMPMMVLSAPAFGVGLLAVVATVLFSFGLHLSVIAVGAVAVSLISVVVFRKTIRFMLSGIRKAWMASCLVLVFSIVILAPVLADRAALTVFQANIADHFGYMATSVVYSQMDFQQILGATLRDHLSNPLLFYARPNLHARPAVSILFAVIGSLLRGATTVGGYAFLCSFAVAGLLSFCAFLLQVFRRSGTTACVMAVILAGAYACGFWGQYPLDINAWSQVAVMPLLLSAWTIVFVELTSPAVVTQGGNGIRAGIAPIIALAVLVAGGIYLYPEGISFHALVLVGAMVAAGRRRLYRLRDIALSLILGASTSLLFWKGTLGFGASQIHTATTSPVAWWRYFDAYLFGMDPEVNQALLDSFANALSRPLTVLVPSHGASLMTGVSGVLGAYFLNSSQSAPYQRARCRKGCFAVPRSCGSRGRSLWRAEEPELGLSVASGLRRSRFARGDADPGDGPGLGRRQGAIVCCAAIMSRHRGSRDDREKAWGGGLVRTRPLAGSAALLRGNGRGRTRVTPMVLVCAPLIRRTLPIKS